MDADGPYDITNSSINLCTIKNQIRKSNLLSTRITIIQESNRVSDTRYGQGCIQYITGIKHQILRAIHKPYTTGAKSTVGENENNEEIE